MAPLRRIRRTVPGEKEESHMADFVYLAAGLAFFAMMWLYAYVCDRV